MLVVVQEVVQGVVPGSVWVQEQAPEVAATLDRVKGPNPNG